MLRSLIACSLALLLTVSACRSAGRGANGSSASASAALRSADGTPMGVLALTSVPGGVLLSGQLTGVPAGAHGIHFHAVGRCDPPEFTTTGAHVNPESRKHGLLNPDGPHAGDLPAVAADAGGRAAVHATTALVTLSSASNGLLDADGSAIVVHAASDDQRTDPSGNSGGRIACGVIERQ